jgi:hypothetical protein
MNMQSKQPIKIIKRKQRELIASEQDAPECELKTERQTGRDIFETITLWIAENKDTRQALYRRERILLRGVFE